MKLALIIVLLCLVPALLLARDLGEIARRERQRRQSLSTPPTGSRVYTNRDLEAYPRETPLTVIRPPTGTAAPPPRARSLEREQAYWKRETGKHRKELARLDARIRRLEWRLAERRSRRKAGARLRPDAMEEVLEESLSALRDDRERLIEDFLERGRRGGALPGWLR